MTSSFPMEYKKNARPSLLDQDGMVRVSEALEHFVGEHDGRNLGF